MPRALALDRLLDSAQRREFVERRARGATRAELRAWLAGLGIHPTEKQLRVGLEHVDRRLEQARAQCAAAAAYRADHDSPDVLAERLAALRRAAVAAVGEDHPEPVVEFLFRVAEMRALEVFASPEPDTRELAAAAEVIVAIAKARATLPSLRPAGPPRKQIIIPPGTVEYITKQIYGIDLSRDPPRSAT